MVFDNRDVITHILSFINYRAPPNITKFISGIIFNFRLCRCRNIHCVYKYHEDIQTPQFTLTGSFTKEQRVVAKYGRHIPPDFLTAHRMLIYKHCESIENITADYIILYYSPLYFPRTMKFNCDIFYVNAWCDLPNMTRINNNEYIDICLSKCKKIQNRLKCVNYHIGENVIKNNFNFEYVNGKITKIYSFDVYTDILQHTETIEELNADDCSITTDIFPNVTMLSSHNSIINLKCFPKLSKYTSNSDIILSEIPPHVKYLKLKYTSKPVFIPKTVDECHIVESRSVPIHFESNKTKIKSKGKCYNCPMETTKNIIQIDDNKYSFKNFNGEYQFPDTNIKIKSGGFTGHVSIGDPIDVTSESDEFIISSNGYINLNLTRNGKRRHFTQIQKVHFGDNEYPLSVYSKDIACGIESYVFERPINVHNHVRTLILFYDKSLVGIHEGPEKIFFYYNEHQPNPIEFSHFYPNSVRKITINNVKYVKNKENKWIVVI